MIWYPAGRSGREVRMATQARWLGTVLGVLGLMAAGLAKAAALETALVRAQSYADERTFDAVIEASREATVSAQIAGRVEAIFFDVDDYVPKGAVILRLTGVEPKARLEQSQAALREAEARQREALDEYTRIKEVYARQLIAKSALDRAEAAWRAAEARLEAARAQVRESGQQVDYTVVRAPYGGYVTKRHVEVGETVNIGQPLMSGFALEGLRAVAQVPQSFVKVARESKQTRIVLADGRSIAGGAVTVFPLASEQSHAYKVRVDLPQRPAGVFPGMFVKVSFAAGRAQGLRVPAQAVVQRSELTAVYVVAADGRVSLRQIRSGRTHNGEVEVLAGLEAGERVALDPVAAAIVLKQQRRQ